MKSWTRRLTALLLCLGLLAGLAAGAAAQTMAAVTNNATHLRTSYSDSNYLDLTISGSTLTVRGKLLADHLQQIQVEVGSASRTVDAASGQLFSAELPLTHSDSAPVKVYTKTAGTTFSSVTRHSIYVQKTSGGYEIMESQVLDNNLTFAESAIDPQDAFRIQVPDTVAAKSHEIVGNETDDYTKVFLLHQWVAENIYYDYDAYYDPDLRTINTATVLDQRRGVCAGYASLLRDLILAQGIPAIYCSNLSLNSGSYALTASGGEDHAHTEAYVDGRWMVMDATWDSNNEYRNGSYLTEAPNGYYYFDITPEAFALDHKTTARDQKDYVVNDDGLGISADGKTLISYKGSGGHVVIPEGVTEIAMECFEKCTTLTGVTFPSTLTTIGQSAFQECTGLTSVYIPDSVTEIGVRAFYMCDNLTSVRLPESRCTIGSYAFAMCSALDNLVVPGTVTLGDCVFSNSGMTRVVLEEGLKEVPQQTFYYCRQLRQIEVPASVTAFGTAVFQNLSSTAILYYGGSEEQWKAVNLGAVSDWDKIQVRYNSSMPDDVESVDPVEPEKPVRPVEPVQPEDPTQETVVPDFQDVPETSWYADAVTWAVERGITSGTTKTTFSPNQTCLRSQILTFLWRALDCPAVTGEMPFDDVNMAAYFGEAARWAAVTGVAGGDKLYPFDPCTRADAVMFLWRALGAPRPVTV